MKENNNVENLNEETQNPHVDNNSSEQENEVHFDLSSIRDKNIATLVSMLGSDAVEIKIQTTLRKVIKSGYKIVFLTGNRMVYTPQIKILWNDITSKGIKKFDNSCKVIPFKSIVDKYPDITAYDENGVLYDLNSPGIEKCLAVIDGQHRITVCLLHYDEVVDADIDIDECNCNPNELIRILNSYDKNWSNEDLKRSNFSTGRTENILYKEADKLVNTYKVSPKYAEYVLTYKKDASKKKDLVKGHDTTEYDKEKAKGGLGIINASMWKFGQAAEIKRIQYLDAVFYVRNEITDRSTFERDMKCFIGSLLDSQVDDIKIHIKEKNYGSLNAYLKKRFDEFRKIHEQEMNSIETTMDANIDSYIEKINKANSEKPVKQIKYGRVCEILKNAKELDEKKSKKDKQQ